MKLNLREDELNIIKLALAEYVLTRKKIEQVESENYKSANSMLDKLIFFERQIKEENNEK